MNDRPESSSGFVMCRRTRATTNVTPRPTANPPPAATTKSSPTPPTVTVATVAASAVRRATSAVASLSSDSPSSTVTSGRGNPIRRPIAVAATASGGATTAPIANAAHHGSDGRTRCTSRPVPSVVNATSPIDSSRIGRRKALKSTSDMFSAEVYSNGGSRPISTTSGVSCTCGTNGRYEPTIPTAISTSGAGRSNRAQNPVTARTTATSATIPNAISTCPSWPVSVAPCSNAAEHSRGRAAVYAGPMPIHPAELLSVPATEQLVDRMGINTVKAGLDEVVGTMPVAGNRQPFGLLHGGANAALAETLGSVLSAVHAMPERFPVGLELVCTHHRAATGGLVTGVARPIHVGRSTSTSEIVITDDNGRVTCTAKLTCLHRDNRPD